MNICVKFLSGFGYLCFRLFMFQSEDCHPYANESKWKVPRYYEYGKNEQTEQWSKFLERFVENPLKELTRRRDDR